jgi:predicted RNA-binding protein with PIN domain
MPPRIIIDGYNLIRQSKTLRAYDAEDIATGREKLIEKLSHYRALKGIPLLVVFDGWQEGNPTEQRTREKGIEIIYSKRGEKADEVIKRLVSRSSGEVTVVTSDREITCFCQSSKCDVIASHLFEEKVEFSFLARIKGLEEDEAPSQHSTTTKKKGPSRRLPKAKRKALRRLKKL